MPSMPWFLLVPIERACHTRKLYAGSTRPAALSLTQLSSGPSFPSLKQKCPPSSPPPAPPSHQLCRRMILLNDRREELRTSKIHPIPGSSSVIANKQEFILLEVCRGKFPTGKHPFFSYFKFSTTRRPPPSDLILALPPPMLLFLICPSRVAEWQTLRT